MVANNKLHIVLTTFSHKPHVFLNFRCNFIRQNGPGQLSRYSDSLRAGRSEDRIPVKARFSAPVQTGSFPEVKRPGPSADHPPQSSAEVKERVELYLYSRSGSFVACYRVNCTFTFTIFPCYKQSNCIVLAHLEHSEELNCIAIGQYLIMVESTDSTRRPRRASPQKNSKAWIGPLYSNSHIKTVSTSHRSVNRERQVPAGQSRPPLVDGQVDQTNRARQ